MALQTAKDTQVVVAGMKAGVKEMKKEFKKIDVDKIEVNKKFVCRIFMFLKIYNILHPRRTCKMRWRIFLRYRMTFKKH